MVNYSIRNEMGTKIGHLLRKFTSLVCKEMTYSYGNKEEKGSIVN